MAATPLQPQPGQRLPLVGGLFQRLFFHHLVLVTVPIVVLGLLLVNITNHSIRETLERESREITTQVSGQIQRFITDVENRLGGIAFALGQAWTDRETGALIPALSENWLNQAVADESYSLFSRLGVVDTMSTLIATTDFSAEPLSAVEENLAGSILDSTRIFAARELRQEEGGSFSMVMAVPIRSGFDELVGAVVAVVDADEIRELVSNITIGDHGYSFLTNSEGQLIAHANTALVYTETSYESLTSVRNALEAPQIEIAPAPVADLISEGDGPAEEMTAHWANISSRSGLHWVLVIHRPTAEVSETSNPMRIQVLIVIIVGIALALISTLVYTRRLVTPIGALVEGANRLSQGDLSYKIPVAGHDELGTLATEFNLMADQLSQIQLRLRRVEHLDTLAKFSSVVAHEIRNPLNAMQINLHLLRERIGQEEQEYLDVISGEILRLENLVREFQTISRPPALSLVRTDMNILLDDLVHLQRGTASTQGVELVTDLESGLPMVEVDRNRITQAVLNVVLNALQAMPTGGKLLVRTRTNEERGSGWILIEVTDTGEGIPEEDLPNVFDFYFTSRDTGSGLGLSIAYRIVFEHGGLLTLNSRPGEGTTVLISLPPGPPVAPVMNESAPRGE
ncbi:ATP-binding protein [Candidatus Zixiibacteriota bacterium]